MLPLALKHFLLFEKKYVAMILYQQFNYTQMGNNDFYCVRRFFTMIVVESGNWIMEKRKTKSTCAPFSCLESLGRVINTF